jgi:hypothetical protein
MAILNVATYLVAAADHCFIHTRPAVSPSVNTCHTQKHFLYHHIFVTCQYIVVFFDPSFSRYVLSNASRKAADDSNAKQCSRAQARCMHLRSFCATGVGISLETSVT